MNDEVKVKGQSWPKHMYIKETSAFRHVNITVERLNI